MRRLACLVGSLGLLASCSSPGQLVLGIGTDLTAQDQINFVHLHVQNRNGSAPPLDHTWKLSGQARIDYRLPGSFNLYAEEGAEPTFDVTVEGLLDGQVRVTRKSALGILRDEQLFIRLALVAKCEDIGCPKSLTCVEGKCTSQKVDVRRLPAFRSELIERSDCASGTTFIDTSTHEALPTGTSCDGGMLCSEGTCLADPLTLPGFDNKPFLGGASEIFGADKSAFFPVGAIDTPRFHATASLLGDGRVLVMGGFPNANIDGKADGGPAPVSGSIAYDPATAAWQRLAEPPYAMGGHTATLLLDGHVLFVGAVGTKPAAMLFDPTTNEFTAIAPPSAPRYFHTATRLLDGKVLIAGGTSQNAPPFSPMGTGEVYDPATQTFTASNGGAVVARVFHSATLLDDGRVVLLGGLDSSGNPVSSAEAFDEKQNKFFGESPLFHARAFHTATRLADGSLLVVGGENEPGGQALSLAEIYVAGSHTETPPMFEAPLARAAHVAIPLGGDRILFVGGTERLEPPTVQPSGGAFLWADGKFSSLPAPSVARIKAFGVLLGDGDVLLGGGSVGGPIVESDGGVMDVDMAMPDDLAMPACDPVGTVSKVDPLCSGGALTRCQLPTVLAYGPVVRVTGTAQCVAAGPLKLGDGCNNLSLPDGGLPPDDCEQGTMCLPDLVSNEGSYCQRLCRSDVDCAGQAPATRCAEVFTETGKHVDGLGVCMAPCTITASPTTCPSGACRYELTHAIAGGAADTVAVCEQGGMIPVGFPCTREAYDTECSIQESCVAGFCHYLCDTSATCVAGGFGTQCVPIASGTAGYCDETNVDQDMFTQNIDMSVGT